MTDRHTVRSDGQQASYCFCMKCSQTARCYVSSSHDSIRKSRITDHKMQAVCPSSAHKKSSKSRFLPSHHSQLPPIFQACMHCLMRQNCRHHTQTDSPLCAYSMPGWSKYTGHQATLAGPLMTWSQAAGTYMVKSNPHKESCKAEHDTW